MYVVWPYSSSWPVRVRVDILGFYIPAGVHLLPPFFSLGQYKYNETSDRQKVLFSDNVSFRCELPKTSKKVAFITPKVRFFSSTMASACFFQLPLLVKHCYISFKQLMELKNTRGQLSTSSGVNGLGQVTHLDVTPRHTPGRCGSPTTTKVPKVRHFTFLQSRFMSCILLVVVFWLRSVELSCFPAS